MLGFVHIDDNREYQVSVKRELAFAYTFIQKHYASEVGCSATGLIS